MSQSLLVLVGQKPLPSREHSLWLKENFEFFGAEVQALGTDLTALCQGFAKLVIVDIALSRDQDNPQLMFESINSTGRALSQADLTRKSSRGRAGVCLDPAQRQRSRVGVKLAREIVSGTGRGGTRRSVSGAGWG